MNIAICDDDKSDLDKTEAALIQWRIQRTDENIAIRSFNSAYALLDAVSGGELFDVFLLDILMPEMTGISLGHQLQKHYAEPLIIYLSYSEDYYPDAFAVYAFQYIQKPFKKDQLFKILDKALIRCQRQRADIFTLKTGDGIVQIAFHTIAYAELQNHLCCFHLADGSVLKSRYLRMRFDAFLAPLLEQPRFIKTHTSFLVNFEYIDRLTPNTLYLKTGDSVPVARAFSDSVRQCYIDYVLNKD